MTFTITTKNKEQTFTGKELVNLSNTNSDFKLDLGFDYILTLQFDAQTNTLFLLNPYANQKFLFKGVALPKKMQIEKMCKIMIDGSDEFISIRLEEGMIHTSVAQENLSEQDIQELYGDDVNAGLRLKIENRKTQIEQARVAIIKQVSHHVNDLKHKISMNSKTGIVLHLALFFASLVAGFGVGNYLMGLPLEQAPSIIQMPTNMKFVLVYSAVIYGIALMLKQGMFLYYQNKSQEQVASKAPQATLTIVSMFFFLAVYVINVIYYMSAGSMNLFAVLMSLFFVGSCITLAIACGYFKSNSVELAKELDKYEYRQDFEHVVKEYQQWIERFINNLSNSKINKIKDKLFMLQIKSVGEIILGILTAPFLAYGVSNTLAMCFPEAAGWIRISGLRLSPIFLVLATFLIVFAFFMFVNAFLCNKKILASNVLKKDGFSNHSQHGVEIYGLEGVKKLDIEMRRSLIIAGSIIFIEFFMNISYFMQEMGGDLSAMFLSALAALVPTALLIAETFMLSQTKFQIHACEDLISKVDRD